MDRRARPHHPAGVPPGSEGGEAVVDILFGAHNPSGTLPVSVPRSPGHLPTRFNHRSHPIEGSPREESPLSPEHPETDGPLFGFGHGLSYTEFETGNLSPSAGSVSPGGSVAVTVDVENVGDRAGTETVHLYGRDEFSSRVTPVRELVDFRRVDLDAGEAATVTFEVDATDL